MSDGNVLLASLKYLPIFSIPIASLGSGNLLVDPDDVCHDGYQQVGVQWVVFAVDYDVL